METVLVQIKNSKAYRLLEDLEELHIIKVLKKSSRPGPKLSEKYAGQLPVEVADELQIQASESRGEWNDRSI
jgi:hypothetical protein